MRCSWGRFPHLSWWSWLISRILPDPSLTFWLISYVYSFGKLLKKQNKKKTADELNCILWKLPEALLNVLPVPVVGCVTSKPDPPLSCGAGLTQFDMFVNLCLSQQCAQNCPLKPWDDPSYFKYAERKTDLLQLASTAAFSHVRGVQNNTCSLF